MYLTSLFKRDRSLDQALDSLDTDLGEMLSADMTLDDVAPIGAEFEDQAALQNFDADVPALVPEEVETGLTAYAQERLSALTSFETMYRDAGADLETISRAFSNVSAVHHLTREYLASTQSTIRRLNDLEQSNTRLVGENNRLRRHAELVARLKAQHEALMESSRRRETKAQQEMERYRQSLADARSETVDARNAVSTMEVERGDLMNALASRTTEAERLGRENEVLRERHVNQAADFEQATKRAAEIQRKYDELSAVHQADAKNLAETRSKLASTEGELVRFQKLNDKLQLDLTETVETVRSLEHDIEEAAARHAAELQVVSNENEAQRAKIAVLMAAQADAASEISTLKHKAKDAETEMRILESRAKQLKQELDAVRASEETKAAAAEGSELLDVYRAENEQLKETVKRMATYERFYRSVKNKQCDKARDEASTIEEDRQPEAEATPAREAAAPASAPLHS